MIAVDGSVVVARERFATPICVAHGRAGRTLRQTTASPAPRDTPVRCAGLARW
jgi:hypothetical protein